MPIYEYKCEKCDEQFEELVSSSDPGTVVCPKCDGPAKKQMSGFAIGSAGSGSGLGGGCASGNCPSGGPPGGG